MRAEGCDNRWHFHMRVSGKSMNQVAGGVKRKLFALRALLDTGYGRVMMLIHRLPSLAYTLRKVGSQSSSTEQQSATRCQNGRPTSPGLRMEDALRTFS